MKKKLLYALSCGVPAVLFTIYAITDIFFFRFLIIVFLLVTAVAVIARAEGLTVPQRRKAFFIPAAFFLSIIGDLFLHYDEGRAPLFVSGVAAYLLAHLSYIGFTLRKGRVKGWLLILLAVAFILYFIFLLVPGIDSTAVKVAVLLYILVSCLSVSAAAAMPLEDGMDRTGRILVTAGISSLLFSDFLLSLHDFVGISTGYFLMLPTFYLSQVLVTCGLIHLYIQDRLAVR